MYWSQILYWSCAKCVSFNDKSYQEINLKSHLSSVLLCKQKKKKSWQICTCPVWFYFTLSDWAHFCNEVEKCQLWKPMKYFSILRPMKIMSDFNMSLGKMSDFVSFLLFRFTLAIKLSNFDFWKSLKCFNIFW